MKLDASEVKSFYFPFTAETFLREIIESPAAYTWAAYSDSPFFVLRNTEYVLAKMLLASGDNSAAERVYRDAITRRETAKRPDQYQIIFAKQRLARFLLEQGSHDEARELLALAQELLVLESVSVFKAGLYHRFLR